MTIGSCWYIDPIQILAHRHLILKTP